jgi:transcriptional regulator with XRE-family HTH domain
MKSPTHRRFSRIFREHLRHVREKKGMTQRDLADALGREHAMVARIELGERRVDFAEAYLIFRALGADPLKELTVILRRFKAIEKE